MRIWCDKCEDLIAEKEVVKTSYGQFCEDCYYSENSDDIDELSEVDIVLYELENKYPRKRGE